MKRFAKRLVSKGILHMDCLKVALARSAGRRLPTTCVVLYYHGIGAHQSGKFALQMQELARLTQPLRADYTGPLEPGLHYAMVTFDDGFRSVVERALPALKAANVPATLFVTTGFLGRRPTWGKHGFIPSEECVLSASELKDLREERTLDIGSHSVNHLSLAAIEDEQARRELVESKRTLESIMGRDVRLFSFPHGAFGEQHLRWAREAGYRRVFSIKPALAMCHPEHYVLGRFHADPDDSLQEFRLKLFGAWRWIP